MEIKDYNVNVDGPNSFDEAVKSNMITYDNIEKLPNS